MDKKYRWQCNSALKDDTVCKAWVFAGYKFCKKCGSPASPPACPKCGTNIELGNNFCFECGMRVQDLFSESAQGDGNDVVFTFCPDFGNAPQTSSEDSSTMRDQQSSVHDEKHAGLDPQSELVLDPTLKTQSQNKGTVESKNQTSLAKEQVQSHLHPSSVSALDEREWPSLSTSPLVSVGSVEKQVLTGSSQVSDSQRLDTGDRKDVTGGDRSLLEEGSHGNRKVTASLDSPLRDGNHGNANQNGGDKSLVSGGDNGNRDLTQKGTGDTVVNGKPVTVMEGKDPKQMERTVKPREEDQHVYVTFYVVLDPEFKYKPNFDVTIRFLDTRLGGTNNRKHKMEFKRTLADNYKLLSYDMSIPLHLASQPIGYNYCVSSGKHEIWEYRLHSQDYFRLLSIKTWSQPLGGSRWTQFDGIILPDKRKWYNYLPNPFSRDPGFHLMGKSLEFMLTVLEEICDLDGSGRCIVTQVDMLCECMGRWPHVEVDTRYTCFTAALFKSMEAHVRGFHKLQKEEENSERASKRLGKAMAMVILMNKYKLNIVHGTYIGLCEALLVHSDPENQTCPDYEDLLGKHFPGYDKTFLGRELEGFINQVSTRFPEEPRWLLCVPLLHFLTDQCRPYGTPNIYNLVLHDTEIWWGIEGIIPMVELLKSNYGTKSKAQVNKFLARISDIAPMDPLLWRTTLASLSHQHLKVIISNEHAPIDAILAMLFYHVKMGNTTMEELKARVKDLIVKNRKFKKELSFPDDRWNVTRWLAEGPDVQFPPSPVWSWANTLKLIGPGGMRMSGDLLVPKLRLRFIIPPKYKDIPLKWNINENNLQVYKMAEIVCTDLLKLLVGNSYEDGWTVIERMVQILELTLEVVHVSSEIGSKYSELNSFQNAVQLNNQRFDIEAGNSVFFRLQNMLPPDLTTSPEPELKVWSSLFNVWMVDEERRKWLFYRITEMLMPRIQKLGKRQVLEFYGYNVTSGTHNQKLVDIFMKSAFEAAKAMLENQEEAEGVFNGDSRENKLIGDVFSHVLLEGWPKQEDGAPDRDNMATFSHALSTPSFCHFLNFFNNKDTYNALMEVCRNCLDMVVSSHTECLQQLTSGEISIKTLRFALDHEQEFIANVEAINKIWTPAIRDSEILKLVLDMKRAEVTALDLHKEEVEYFITRCGTIDVDCHDLENKLKALTEDLLLSEVCENPWTYNLAENAKSPETPNITFFGLGNQLQNAITELFKLKKSVVFYKIFLATVKELVQDKTSPDMGEIQLSIEDLTTQIWPQSEIKWKALCEATTNGSVTLQETDVYFLSIEDEVLEEELHLMCRNEGGENIVGKRMEEIQRYRQLEQCEKGAEIVLQFKNEFGLTGNFRVLEDILGVFKKIEKTTPLSTMSDDLVRTAASLDTFTEPRIECLQTFIKCKPLIDWLKENVERPQELKALVDLALMAASGKGDEEMMKVSCLHAAAMGFTPLIYNLRRYAGYEEFRHQCEAIWPRLEADPNLPQKLSDVNRSLEWLKGVKDAQGDVETTALEQVTSINSRGIYIIKKQNDKQSALMTLDDLVQVEVPRAEKNGTIYPEKKYTFGNLKELQSKLMLIAGKAEAGLGDVETFVETFDGVTSLANTFVKICTAGSILFKDWSAMFYCDQNLRVNAMVDFGLAKGKLAGLSAASSLTQQITQIRDFMEGCLGDWKAYITRQRMSFPELNLYTTEQLVILRHELTCLTRDQGQPSPKVMALLHDIAPMCDYNMLKRAFSEAKREIWKKSHEPNASIGLGDERLNARYEEDQQDEDEKRERIIKQLEEGYGHKRKIIEKAIAEVGLEEEEDQLAWKCEELAELESSTEDERMAMEEAMPPDYSIMQSDATLDTTTRNHLSNLERQHLTLGKKLRSLWSEYLGSSSMSMADYFSVEHLGLILNLLRQREPLHRSLPPYTKPGKPNLIVCPQDDILIHILSLYMEQPHLPLPDREEVLVCTENTTLEEVELLLWRSVQDTSGRIFVLVKADLLNYEVAGQVERAIEHLFQGHDGYNFVVVCSAERQDQSLLVAALDGNRVHGTVPQDKDQVRKYVHQLLSTAREDLESLDPESLSVRVVRSDRAGEGKSLWVKRKQDLFAAQNQGSPRDELIINLPQHGSTARVASVLDTLLQHVRTPDRQRARIIHIDIPHEMQDGVDHLLFNLVVLGSLVDPIGYIWRRSNLDYYLIGIMPLLKWEIGAGTHVDQEGEVHRILGLLPGVTCRSPLQSLKVLQRRAHNPEYIPTLRLWQDFDQLMDREEFESIPFQRVFQYLQALEEGEDLREVDPYTPRGTQTECLKVLLRFCGLEDPSWAELVHFIHFLDQQLERCENSAFCAIAVEDEGCLPGFLHFIVRFMLQMSRDFATRSLVMAHDPPVARPANTQADDRDDEQEQAVEINAEIEQFQLKRRWEESPHPYIFFNPDGTSLTFLGFVVQEPTYDIIDAQTNNVLERAIMTQQLFRGLKINQVKLDERFDVLSREEKILKLCMVMGVEAPYDPDNKYVLTTDNVMKILAIQMRFRCGIPVVIMGETGCGKTHLIKFMCSLQVPYGIDVKNMILMKVHGGTTEDDIVRKVEEAAALAETNRRLFPQMNTVLFLDEVNTTEALGLVKEVLCDFTLRGKPLNTNSGLKLIAACNPYRKHSDEVIQKLEKAGLGYHVRAEDTRDKLGRIPMRRLVYRVQPLPQSLLPLVWDFGQLNDLVEKMYITQIVQKKMDSGIFGIITPEEINTITNILVAAQTFMRNQQDECSFVSLRDVERVMEVLEWFYHRVDLFKYMDDLMQKRLEQIPRQGVNQRQIKLQKKRIQQLKKTQGPGRGPGSQVIQQGQGQPVPKRDILREWEADDATTESLPLIRDDTPERPLRQAGISPGLHGPDPDFDIFSGLEASGGRTESLPLIKDRDDILERDGLPDTSQRFAHIADLVGRQRHTDISHGPIGPDPDFETLGWSDASDQGAESLPLIDDSDVELLLNKKIFPGLRPRAAPRRRPPQAGQLSRFVAPDGDDRTHNVDRGDSKDQSQDARLLRLFDPYRDDGVEEEEREDGEEQVARPSHRRRVREAHHISFTNDEKETARFKAPAMDRHRQDPKPQPKQFRERFCRDELKPKHKLLPEYLVNKWLGDRPVPKVQGVTFDDNMDEDETEEDDFEIYEPPNEICRALILALGVCYHACLQEKREEFREFIAQHFQGEFELDDGARTILENISLCQDVFLNEVDLETDIARNQALKENVFMMVVCIELRIPLFLVGKPGSSKSLAKTIVDSAMQGPQSKSELFRKFKAVTMLSYQCSPLSTPNGIVGIFDQCANLQQYTVDLEKFVAVVVLDEVGLAEDSPRMPLKALHPLLEDGCHGDNHAEKYMKVGFIGISNWALDPAKMNRGILVQRGPPDEKELRETARGICSSGPVVEKKMSDLIAPLAKAYLELYNSAITEIREFFGLRDFYSLVKMLHVFAEEKGRELTWHQLKHTILRNFGGLDKLNPLPVFEKHVLSLDKQAPKQVTDPDNTTLGLLKASLYALESRYLLLLTENYAALTILMQEVEAMREAIIIFGSSFPKDQEYTVVCRNINRIKVCMETGQTVVLLNLENLYESLYDALNQNYSYFGGQRHVDLGLGGHRVKASVHQKFKLIVVAEKDGVYQNFPIPLINRLEKHFLAMTSMLTQGQKEVVEKLERWVQNFVQPPIPQQGTRPSVGDAFVGYHPDTCASIVLKVCHEMGENEGDESWASEVLNEAKDQLLWCATPESVIRTNKTRLAAEEKEIADVYFSKQEHGSLAEYLQANIMGNKTGKDEFIQVATHSRLLNNRSLKEIARHLELPPTGVDSQSLESFNTEQQFSKLLRKFYCDKSETDQVLIIQCDSGDGKADLIACARYIIIDENKQFQQQQKTAGGQRAGKHVVLVIQLPRIIGGSFAGLEGSKWRSIYLDDLRMVANQRHQVDLLKQHTISALMKPETLLQDQNHEGNTKDPEQGHGSNTQVLEQDQEGDVEDPERNQEGKIQDPIQDEEGTIQDPDHIQEAADPEPLAQNEGNIGPLVDINDIVQQCILGATSMVKDAVDAGSSTARIATLIKLLSSGKEKGQWFMEALKKRIYLLLKEKESIYMTEAMAMNWLVNDAASMHVINKAGTFRRAISLSLEMKVTAVLACLIAFMDCSDNLSIVTSEDAPTWKSTMWLSMFQNPTITQVSYSDLLKPKTNTELEEMTVLMLGAEGHKMTSCLPFSWLIKQQIDILLHQLRRAGEEEYDLLGAVGHLLKETALWPVLEAAFVEAGPAELSECYLDDHIKMVYRPQSSQHDVEYELVKRAIKTTIKWMKLTREKDTSVTEPKLRFEHQLPLIHMAESLIHRRLQLFSQVARCCPNIIKQVWEFYETEKEHPLTTADEMTVDVLTLRLVVEGLRPTPELLRNAEQNRKWHEQIRQLEPLVNDMLTRSLRIEYSGLGSYGTVCKECLQNVRKDWNCAAMVKLFVDMVSPRGSDQEKNCTKTCPILWRKLNDANFKNEKTMKNIENFLMLVTKNACQQYIGEAMHCELCKDFNQDVLILPCKHTVCQECINQTQQAGDYSCPRCKKTYSRNITLPNVQTDRESLKKLQAFKGRCNSYLMEVVSRQCFAGDAPPEPGLVKMLMSYITYKGAAPKAGAVTTRHAAKTKNMNLFNDNLDPTPVIRSVLLQLLLRSSVTEVRDYLLEYLSQAEQFLTKEDGVELAIIYTQCLEDHYHSAVIVKVPRADLAETAMTFLRECRVELSELQDQVSILEVIAKIRFALSITAEHMAGKETFDPVRLKGLFFLARRICENENNWELPRIYLIRLLARRYGLDTLLQVSAEPSLRWVLPDKLRPREDAMRPDMLIIHGQLYRETREALTQVLITPDDTEQLTTMMAGTDADSALRSVDFLLAMFSVVTMTYSVRDVERRPSHQALNALQEVIRRSPGVLQKELAEALLRNTLANQCPELLLVPDLSNQDLIIREIIIHFGITMATITQPGLLTPFFRLVATPEEMQHIFLPTMPEDVRGEIMDALLDARHFGRYNENPVLYECPNGHPYIIGNCGRPAYLNNCRACGARIGGQNYRLHAGRQVRDLQDTTKPGHVLGDPRERSLVAGTERELSPTPLVLTRLLLHLSLYTGANTHIQAIKNLIHQPNLDLDDIAAFLMGHIKHDMEMLSRVAGKSRDDCAVLVHLLINTLANTPVEPQVEVHLSSKQVRKAWEKEFASVYIAPFLHNLDGRLREANQLIANDRRLGPNPLLKLIHETENRDLDVEGAEAAPPGAPEPEQVTMETGLTGIELEPAMWRYRTRVTIEHLQQELNKTHPGEDQDQNQHGVLRLFLDREPELRVVQLLPQIFTLIRKLSQRYHRKINRADADEITVRNFLETCEPDSQREECEGLFADFCTAWRAVHSHLSTYVISERVLPEEYCNLEMNIDAPISALLPSLRGRGLCALALTNYLITVHNNFITEFTRLAHTSPGPEVSSIDLTPAHLITYDLDRDLLPLVWANCSYSLAVGHGTRIEYNFVSLEQQLQERFIYGKPTLTCQLEPVAFSEDMTNANLFTNLEKKIPQVALTPREQAQIRNELHHIVEVTECLSKLNIAIGFLVSVGGEPHTKLQVFMGETLQMPNTYLSRKAMHYCELQHSRSLWLLYSHEREKLAARLKQDPFSLVDVSRYREPVSEEEREQLELVLRRMKVNLFLDELYECIVMHLTIKQSQNDEDYMDNTKQRLKDALYGYIESKDGPDIPALLEDTFPDITVDQCVETWRIAYSFSLTQHQYTLYHV